MVVVVSWAFHPFDGEVLVFAGTEILADRSKVALRDLFYELKIRNLWVGFKVWLLTPLKYLILL